MNNKKQRQAGSHGAVTVFLSIVLVPCIVFASIFCDLSRVQLSTAASASAGDLAMYSLLSRYDETLKEYYGLVASCQNIDQFFEITQTYFTGMLQAEGVPDEGSQLFIDYLNNLRSGNYSNLLRVEISDLKVADATNNQLGQNPALIEDSVVEFMKYRGPIQIATNIVDRFTDLKLEETVAEADKNKEIADAKQVYAEKQGELLEKAFYTYLAIREYEKAQKEDRSYQEINQKDRVPSYSGYNDLQARLDAIRTDLREATRLVTQFYYPGTENLDDRKFPLFDDSKSKYQFKPESSSIATKVYVEGEPVYYLRYSKLKTLMGGGRDLDQALEKTREQCDQVREKCDQVYEACKDIPKPAEIGGSSDNNEVYYTLEMQKTTDAECDLDGIKSGGDELLKRRGRLQAAMSLAIHPDDVDKVGDDWQNMVESACDIIESLYNDCLSETSSGDYPKMANEYNQVGPVVKEKVSKRQYEMTSKFLQMVRGSANGDIVTFARVMNNYLPVLYQLLEEQRDRLTIAIDGGEVRSGKNAISLDELVDLAGEFQTTRNDWGSAANRYSTDYAKSEQNYYNGASAASGGSTVDESQKDEMEGERIAAQITGESVQELKERLTNIKTDIEAALQALESFQYGGTAVKDLGGHEGLITAAHTVVPTNDTHSLSAASSAAASYTGSLVSPASGAIYTAPNQNNAINGNDPVLTNQPPKLYKFLKNQLGNEEQVEKEVDENKERNEKYKEQAQKAKDNASSVDNDLVANKGSDLERVHGDHPFTPLTALGSVISVVKNVTSGSADELRDQLYVCEYIMSMFTYSTLDNEGKYRLMLRDDSYKNVTYRRFDQDGYGPKKSEWEAEDPKNVMENQSLTNRPLIKTNNHANLGEVEYILFGNAEIDENLKIAYGNIFAIREMLNLVSGFCNFYSGQGTTGAAIAATAMMVQSATVGIVPVPLTKCILIGALATLETAKDLERLKKGGRVELYKSEEKNWACGIEGVAKDLTDGRLGQEKAFTGEAESGMYYSDYLRIFLLLGLTNQDSYSSMLLRVGDLVHANMRLVEGEKPSFDIDKARCYFNLTATVRVKPLMISLPIVLNNAPDAKKLIDVTDWCTYKINVTRGYS